MRLAGLLHGQYMTDLGTQPACRDPRLHRVEASLNESAVLCQDAQPEPMRAQALCHHYAGIELVPLSGRGAVDDYAPKRAAAAQALSRVLTAQHFEDCIHALAIGQFVDSLFVIALAVV